jgi:hypothetical protein
MVIESNSVCADTAYLNTAIFTSVTAQQSIPVRIYPNPCSGLLYLEGLQDNLIYDVQLLDIISQRCIAIAQVRESTLDISAIPAGTYLVQLTDENYRRAIIPIVKID